VLALAPLLDGTGYHFDGPTITKMVFAGLLAVFGYLAKDFDKTGRP
jgi:hypothetical protein